MLSLPPSTPEVASEGGARDIDMYRYSIEQVRLTLISQPKLANRRITGGQAECTTNVYLAQELFS